MTAMYHDKLVIVTCSMRCKHLIISLPPSFEPDVVWSIISIKIITSGGS